MRHETMQTDDRATAMSFLNRLLDTPETVNAEISHLNGVYSIEVSCPTDDCAGDSGEP